MRTMNKSKNKKGVVLVTILFILAIAMIFIASALILTKATRDRIYVRAEDNQARLTVTSAAESFYQALYLQEIKDDDLLAMDGAVLEITNPDMPGMESGHTVQDRYGERCPDDGQTIAEFDVDANQAVINFKTNIGGQVECIQMGLQIKDPDTKGNNFPNVVELGDGGSLNLARVGYDMSTGGRKNADDNLMIVHGDVAHTSKGSSECYSTYITTGMLTDRDVKFYGDVVFWGPDAGLDFDLLQGQAIKLQNNTNSVFFINTKNSFYWNGTPVTPANYSSDSSQFTEGKTLFDGGDGVVFYNNSTEYSTTAHFINENHFQGLNFYSSGSVNLSGIGYHNINASVTTVNPNLNQNPVLRGQPTASQSTRINSYTTNRDFTMGGADHTACFTYVDNGLTGNGSESIPAPKNGVSTLQADHGYVLAGTLEQKIIYCDLNDGDYYIYVNSGLTIGKDAAIIAANGNNDNGNLYIVIGKNGYIDFAGQTNGIISTNVYTGVDFSDLKSSTIQDCINTSKINQSVSPYIYIYGDGSSAGTSGQLRFSADNQVTVMTAYCALYPHTFDNDAGDYTNDAGCLKMSGNANPLLYGRVFCSQFVLGSDSCRINIPYCPEPNTDGPSDKPKVQYTKFRICDYQYYTM